MHSRDRRYTKKTTWRHKTGVFQCDGGWIVRVLVDGYKKTISRHDTEEEALTKFNKENGQM